MEIRKNVPQTIRIGSRKSKLALIQTDMVIQMIQQHFPQIAVEVVTMQTLGDRLLNQNLNKIGGKGVFTQELEQALLQKDIDMAVHSAKDMPLILPSGVSLHPVGVREDASDVLVTCKTHLRNEMLTIGTSSLRRSILIKQMYPHAKIKDIRGNVETRLQKLRSGEYDGIILANAGLKRIAKRAEAGFLEQFSYVKLNPQEFMPAACQGILALETRSGEFNEIIQALTDEDTKKCFDAEREFLRVMAGGCNAPCGISTKIQDNGIHVHAFFAKEMMHDGREYEVIGDVSTREKRDIAGSRFSNIKKVSTVLQDISNMRSVVERLKFGCVHLVGAGIGSEEHLTKEAQRYIQEADCIVYDSLLSPSILNEAKLCAELIFVGKRFGEHSMKQEDIQDLLVTLAKSGKDVVRLKGGDPFVFGRGGEEALRLKEEHIPFRLTPGISSCIAVPEHVKIPVTHRGTATAFHVITGHEMTGNAGVDEHIAKLGGTLVFLMGLNNAAKIADQLMQFGKDRDTKVAIISKGMSEQETCITTTLSEMGHVVQTRNIEAPVIIVMGDVVEIGQSLQDEMHETFPLFGKSVLMTGTRSMVQKLRPQIRKAGGRDIAISLIETIYEPSEVFEQAMKNLHEYSCLIFTSSNGVEAFFKYIRELTARQNGFDQRNIAHLRFAVIGEGSADTLRSYGYVEDFIPSAFTSVQLADELLPRLSFGEKVLLVRAKEANPYLTQKMDEMGISYTDAYIYKTHVDHRRKEELQRVLTDIDYVTLASPSAVRAFREMAGEEIFCRMQGNCFEEADFDLKDKARNHRPRIASIGPETTKECKKQGIRVDVTAKVNTASGLVEAIVEFEAG